MAPGVLSTSARQETLSGVLSRRKEGSRCLFPADRPARRQALPSAASVVSQPRPAASLRQAPLQAFRALPARAPVQPGQSPVHKELTPPARGPILRLFPPAIRPPSWEGTSLE